MLKRGKKKRDYFCFRAHRRYWRCCAEPKQTSCTLYENLVRRQLSVGARIDCFERRAVNAHHRQQRTDWKFWPVIAWQRIYLDSSSSIDQGRSFTTGAFFMHRMRVANFNVARLCTRSSGRGHTHATRRVRQLPPSESLTTNFSRQPRRKEKRSVGWEDETNQIRKKPRR